jgi:hypothetical protein
MSQCSSGRGRDIFRASEVAGSIPAGTSVLIFTFGFQTIVPSGHLRNVTKVTVVIPAYFAGHRRSISVRICSAYRIASAMALIVAGTRAGASY